MDGILVIDKPPGITSHDVVARVRRVLKTKRVGHTGTLDPFATGVMVILVGKATRLAQFLDKDEKEYQATLRFGYETDTGDFTGEKRSDGKISPANIAAHLRSIDWDAALDAFRGDIEQVPPMYSAKKVDGKKLYESARKGIDVPRKAALVTISKLEALPTEFGETMGLRVVCSAGTYIRSLAEDIGRRVGVGAHLIELRRTRAGHFDLSQSTSLECLAAHVSPESSIMPMEMAVLHLPAVKLNVDRAAKTKSGLSTRLQPGEFTGNQAVRMLSDEGDLLAIGFYDDQENSIRPKVVLV